MADIFKTQEEPKSKRVQVLKLTAGDRIVFTELINLQRVYYPKMVLEVTHYEYAPISKLVLATRGGEREKEVYYHHNDTLSVYVEDEQ